MRLWAIFPLKRTRSSSGRRCGPPDGAPADGGWTRAATHCI